MDKLTKEYIQNILVREDELGQRAVGRALMRLLARQTSFEQISESTQEHNLRGFTPSDARMGTSMAQQYSRTGYLSPKQMAYWHKPNRRGQPRICKYWRQLLEDAKECAAQKAAQESTV